MDFRQLNSRYEIRGSLEPAESLHVGCGAGTTDTDAAFLKDALGPLIPGSSLRGAMRSRLERILQTVRPGRGCVLFAEGSHPTCVSAATRVEQRRVEGLPEGQRLAHLNTGGACDICRLFGCTLFASRLRIADSRPETAAALQVRHGVGIDRDADTAREKIKYDFEALERGPLFSFELTLENADAKDFALLSILLGELADPGIPLGGKKSRGFGLCRLQAGFQVSCFDQEGPFRLADFLRTRRLEPVLADEFRGKLARALEAYLAEGEDHVAAVA